MTEFHCVLQSKGGVGKSVVSSWFVQYLASRGPRPLAFECDPANETLTRYKGLRTTRLDLLDHEDQIDRGLFDDILEILLGDEEPIVLMDNGQAAFLPLARYLIECDAVDMLEKHGRRTVIHTVVTGGQSGVSTLQGLSAVLEQVDGRCPIVVWQNEHFGPVNTKVLETLTEPHRDRLVGPIRLLERSKPFENNVRQMLEGYLTFEEAIASGEFRVMQKQRLTMVRRQLFEEIAHAFRAYENRTAAD